MIIYIVFLYNPSKTYITQRVCSTEEEANKTIKRLKKLDKKHPNTNEGYFYEEHVVDKQNVRVAEFLESRSS